MSDVSNENLHDLLRLDRFPLSSKYDPAWIAYNEMGPNALWLSQSLCAAMDLRSSGRPVDPGEG